MSNFCAYATAIYSYPSGNINLFHFVSSPKQLNLFLLGGGTHRNIDLPLSCDLHFINLGESDDVVVGESLQSQEDTILRNSELWPLLPNE